MILSCLHTFVPDPDSKDIQYHIFVSNHEDDIHDLLRFCVRLHSLWWVAFPIGTFGTKAKTFGKWTWIEISSILGKNGKKKFKLKRPMKK